MYIKVYLYIYVYKDTFICILSRSHVSDEPACCQSWRLCSQASRANQSMMVATRAQLMLLLQVYACAFWRKKTGTRINLLTQLCCCCSCATSASHARAAPSAFVAVLSLHARAWEAAPERSACSREVTKREAAP